MAEARPRAGDDVIEWPLPVTLDEARAAEKRYVGHHHHAFPTCFTCGTGREEDDGLRIMPRRYARQVRCTPCPTVRSPSGGGRRSDRSGRSAGSIESLTRAPTMAATSSVTATPSGRMPMLTKPWTIES